MGSEAREHASVHHQRELFEYLVDFRKAMVDAHRHKETLGWAITAFYLVGAIQVVANVLTKGMSVEARLGVALAFVVPTVLLLTYERRMINLRGYYIHMSGAVEMLITEYLAGDLDALSADQLRPRPPKSGPEARHPHRLRSIYRYFFPSRIVPDQQYPDLYPAFILDQAKKWPGSPGRSRAYDFPYMLMWFAAIAAVAGIFLRA